MKLDATALLLAKKTAEKIKTKIDRGVKEGSLKIKHTARKHICGDENLSIRKHLEETRKSPPVVKLVDKLSFTCGVLWLCVTEWWVLLYPETFGKFYSFSISGFIALRYYMYRKEKYTYFLYDMCYFVDFMCILQVWAMPSSWHHKLDVLIPESLRGRAAHALFLTNFSLVTGPLAWAIPLWRNSLVFHSLDKVTSVFIHFLPQLFVFCYRWFPHATGFNPTDPKAGLPPMGLNEWFVRPLCLYLVWQSLYLFITEFWYRKELDQDPEIQTSLRWLVIDSKNIMNKIVHQVCWRTGLLKPKENLDVQGVKTLLVFVAAQFIYTWITMIPVYLVYTYFHVHLAFLIYLFVTCAYNGACYYIEVFAERYQQQFTPGAKTHFSDEPPKKTN
jgi:hypothetical protein